MPRFWDKLAAKALEVVEFRTFLQRVKWRGVRRLLVGRRLPVGVTKCALATWKEEEEEEEEEP